MDFVAGRARKILRECILKFHDGAVEQKARLGLLGVILLPVLVVNIDESWVLNDRVHHLGQEVAKQADKSFNVLFASEEDFLSGNVCLPARVQSWPLVIIENTFVKHDVWILWLKDLHMLLGVGLVRLDLTTWVFAIDEEFDRAILVCFHLSFHSLAEGIHVEFV